jgi:hypothetical protein
MCHAVGVYTERIGLVSVVGLIHICLALLKNQSTSSGSSSPMVNVRSPVLFSLRARFSGLDIAYPVMSQEQAVIIFFSRIRRRSAYHCIKRRKEFSVHQRAS